MITGDENIVDIDFRVMWKISMAENFLFNLQDPEETVKVAAEFVMRGIIGQIKIESALTDAKELIQSQARSKLQELVDEYGAGIEIRMFNCLVLILQVRKLLMHLMMSKGQGKKEISL